MKFLNMIVVLMITLVLAPSLRAAEGGELIWWGVSDVASLDVTDRAGNTLNISDFNINAARIRYADNAGVVGYLDVYAFNANNEFVEIPVGVGAVPGAYFSPLTGSLSTYTYVVELGNYSGGTWTEALESGAATYNQLMESHHIAQWDDVTANYAVMWNPTGYTVVPEPSGGILFLVGGALLLLRRRTEKERASDGD